MAIILEKGGDTHRINLEKSSGRPLAGEIVINLDWNKGGAPDKPCGGLCRC